VFLFFSIFSVLVCWWLFCLISCLRLLCRSVMSGLLCCRMSCCGLRIVSRRVVWLRCLLLRVRVVRMMLFSVCWDVLLIIGWCILWCFRVSWCFVLEML